MLQESLPTPTQAGELFGGTAGEEAKDDTEYAGSEIRVSYGREHYQPFRFQGFDIGPFEMTVTVKEGETPMQAKRRAMKILEEMAEEEIRVKGPRYKARIHAYGDASNPS